MVESELTCKLLKQSQQKQIVNICSTESLNNNNNPNATQMESESNIFYTILTVAKKNRSVLNPVISSVSKFLATELKSLKKIRI